MNAPTSLKNLDFSKFMNNNYDYSDEENSPQKKELRYCDTTYLGKTGLKLGNDNSKPKVSFLLISFIRSARKSFVQNVMLKYPLSKIKNGRRVVTICFSETITEMTIN